MLHTYHNMMPTALSFRTVSRFVFAIKKSHFHLFQPSSLNVGGGVGCRYRRGLICLYLQPARTPHSILYPPFTNNIMSVCGN